MSQDRKKCIFTSQGVHCPLGIFHFEPIQKPFNLSGKESFTFNLSNGKVTDDAAVAAQMFLEREFSNIAKGQESEVEFLPGFISKIPEILDYGFLECKDVDTKQKEFLCKKYKEKMGPNNCKLLCDRTEHALFSQMKSKFENHASGPVKDVIVLNGWKCMWSPIVIDPRGNSHSAATQVKKFTPCQSQNRANVDMESKNTRQGESVEKGKPVTEAKELECDVLIVSLSMKCIIYIECKANWRKAGKASEQLERCRTFLAESMTFDKNWKFVKACAFYRLEQDSNFTLCSHCKDFVIHPENTFSAFWDNLSSQMTFSVIDPAARQTYIEIVKRLTFLQHVHFPKEPLTKSEASQALCANINKASTKRNILLWSKDQFRTLYCKETKVLFLSSFGTGKTILLQAKAAEVAKTNPGQIVYYIICSRNGTSSASNLAAKAAAKRAFSQQSINNIRVLNWKDVLDERRKEKHLISATGFETLGSFISGHKAAAGFFIDEDNQNEHCFHGSHVNRCQSSISSQIEVFESFSKQEIHGLVKAKKEQKMKPLPAPNEKRQTHVHAPPFTTTNKKDGTIHTFSKPSEQEVFALQIESLFNTNCNINNQFIWMALSCDPYPTVVASGLERTIMVPNLRHNLRNTQEIIAEANAAYPHRSNQCQGRRPIIIQTILFHEDLDRMSNQLFEAFKEALADLSDENDLLVVWDFGFSSEPFISSIRRFCEAKNTPLYIARADSQAEGDLCIFFKERKGILLGDMTSIEGCDFKSVIAFFELDEGRKRLGHSRGLFSPANTILRAICNLVVVDYVRPNKRI